MAIKLCSHLHVHDLVQNRVHSTFNMVFCPQLALLCGAPGLGKTTLAQMNARLDYSLKHFSVFITV